MPHGGGQEALPVAVSCNMDLVEIIESGTAQGTIGKGEAAGLDNVDGDAEAGAEPE